MCGITGYIELDGSPACLRELKKMTDSISHRGPDSEGHWLRNNVGIGHRRLSVIDLTTAADQPMHSSDQRFILTYNGEIYNFQELREELEAKGFQFQTQSDTEVVLNSLICWGSDALIKFNGMFALAFWDSQKHKLLLARDRYGIKPLYFSIYDNRFFFGSEQKAITINSNFRAKLNKAALLEYFTFQNIFTQRTLIENITLLKAGHYLLLDTKNATWDTEVYWDYKFNEPSKARNENECLEELDRLFVQAVKRQLVADTELGAYLSGGIDSGCISSIASEEIPNLKSFTVGFDLSSASGLELAFDERQKAEAISGLLKTEHYEMVLKAGDMERCLADLAWHLEEPRVGQSYPNYYAAKLASKFVKVVLSGSGGDELFGGYSWRYYSAAKSQDFESFIDEYYLYWQRLIPNSVIKKAFAPIWNDVKDVHTRDIFRDVFLSHENELSRPEDYINHSLYFEAKTFLHGLFIVEDKLSMAHGLESRVPFMDNDLVEFAMNCPVRFKLKNLQNSYRINENEIGHKPNKFYQKTSDGKQILREMTKKYISPDVALGEKQGFSSPDASWFKGESIDYVRNTLFDKDAKIYEILDKATIQMLLNQHLNGNQNRRLLIWSLLNIEHVVADLI